MSIENTDTIVEPTVTEDLDAFSAELFGRKEADTDKTKSEEVKTEDKESDALNENEDTQTDEDDTLATEDEDETEDTETDEDDSTETDDKSKKPKNRFQERIDELTAKAREAERREQATLKRFEELEKKLSQSKDEKPEPVKEAVGPAVDDKNEDGSEKYPLGEFDPNYIRDLTRFTLEQERNALKAKDEQEAQQKKFEAEREALTESWTEKLGPAKERYPDFNEKGEQLFGTFNGINQAYGEYLTATLMSMDFGPDVLYYLANNLDEANKIVASGPTKATIALGRLEAKFADAEAEKQTKRPKVSKAAPPPDIQLKGSNAVMPEVPDDTDDLDAFAAKLFKKKK